MLTCGLSIACKPVFSTFAFAFINRGSDKKNREKRLASKLFIASLIKTSLLFAYRHSFLSTWLNKA